MNLQEKLRQLEQNPAGFLTEHGQDLTSEELFACWEKSPQTVIAMLGKKFHTELVTLCCERFAASTIRHLSDKLDNTQAYACAKRQPTIALLKIPEKLTAEQLVEILRARTEITQFPILSILRDPQATHLTAILLQHAEIKEIDPDLWTSLLEKVTSGI
jgi:hypothetical protein